MPFIAYRFLIIGEFKHTNKKCNDDARAFFTERIWNHFIFQNSDIVVKNENIRNY